MGYIVFSLVNFRTFRRIKTEFQWWITFRCFSYFSSQWNQTQFIDTHEINHSTIEIFQQYSFKNSRSTRAFNCQRTDRL